MTTSYRHQVSLAVTAQCALLRRPVTLGEVATALPTPDAVPHLDAVLGSLVRTGHLRADRARSWVREQRNVYQPVGAAFLVDPAAVPPSRAERVYGIIEALWAHANRGGVPVTSREIRVALRARDATDALCTAPALLPTVLNDLRRPGRTGRAMIRAIAVPGVRAQCWVPISATAAIRRDVTAVATDTDRVAIALEAALLDVGALLVSVLEVRAAWSRLFGPDRAGDVPRLLWSASRPVPAETGGRVARRRPAVVRVGEVGGLALYTRPARCEAPAGTASGAETEWGWRRWLEGWRERRLDDELEWLRGHDDGDHLYVARRRLVARQVASFASLAARLDRRADHVHEACQFRAMAHQRLAQAATVPGLSQTAGCPRGWLAGAPWVTVDQAEAWAIRTFRLGDDPPCIASAFLADEVRRVRIPPGRRGGPARSGGAERWRYDPVTLTVACTDRWGTPGAVIGVRHGASLLGPIRSLVALEDDHRRRAWDPADYEAARALLLAYVGVHDLVI